MDTPTKLLHAKHDENLERVQMRFVQWRETRVRGEHIPAALWAEAVEMTVEHGLDRVAQELHVDYDRLKKRLAQAGGEIQALSITARTPLNCDATKKVSVFLWQSCYLNHSC